jgi:hypothetical protein
VVTIGWPCAAGGWASSSASAQDKTASAWGAANPLTELSRSRRIFPLKKRTA